MKLKQPCALFAAAFLLALTSPAAMKGETPVGTQSTEQTNAPGSQAVHTYRLTFTVTELDGGKRVGVQHFSMTAVPNERATMKQGSKIPVMTGTVQDAQSPKTNSVQFTYIDVGLNCDATLAEKADGVEANIKLEQSSVADAPSILGGVAEPVIRQAVLQNASILKQGTPVMLGSLDVPGSTRHLDIEVALERVM